MEKIADRYPEAAPHLEALPEHAAQHAGSIALRLTHEDMHPKTETAGQYGGTELAADLSKVITDPEYDSSQLAVEAVEAAHAGKKQLAEVIQASAEMLHAAHDKLATHIGPRELETDEQRDNRELAERNAIYDAACEQALVDAVVAKDKGDNEGAVRALESSILLRFMKGDDSRQIFREAIRDNLGNELLEAAQLSNKIFTGRRYERVSDSMSGAHDLLAMATGKSTDSQFAVTGEASLSSIYPMSGEDLKDAVAVMTSEHGWLTLDQGFEAFGNFVQIAHIKDRLKPELAPGSVGSAEYFYQLVEKNADPQVLEQVFRSSDPLQTLSAAEQLGLSPSQITRLFEKPAAESGEAPQLDTVAIQKMSALKEAHPKHFNALVQIQNQGEAITYDPEEISKGIEALAEVGIDDSDFTVVMTDHENISSFVSGCLALSRSFSEIGVSPNKIHETIERAGLTLRYVLYEAATADDTFKVAESLVCRAETMNAYLELYDEMPYPYKQPSPKLELDTLPHVRKRISQLGIPEDLATEMFKSWATYDAFADHFFDEGKEFPEEKPSSEVLTTIALKQEEMVDTQLKSLEGFVEKHGLEATSSIISIFGIYNFSRYEPDKLIQQFEAWQAGERIQNVVVNARHDWNTFTSGKTVFEDAVDEGLFYFEANSGYDAARIAVKIGQHERDHRREPDVERFIMHAHGNSELMVMGADGESISLSTYYEAARNASKIGANEVNDYKKHLGQNFEIILQSCSTGSELDYAGKNIAQMVSERHAASVHASKTDINGLTIKNDGTVLFRNPDNKAAAVTYG